MTKRSQRGSSGTFQENPPLPAFEPLTPSLQGKQTLVTSLRPRGRGGERICARLPDKVRSTRRRLSHDEHRCALHVLSKNGFIFLQFWDEPDRFVSCDRYK